MTLEELRARIATKGEEYSQLGREWIAKAMATPDQREAQTAAKTAVDFATMAYAYEEVVKIIDQGLAENGG